MPKATEKSDKKKARDLENWALHTEKERFGGLNRSERRKLQRLGVDLDKCFSVLDSPEGKRREAVAMREELRREYPAWLEEQAKLEEKEVALREKMRLEYTEWLEEEAMSRA